MGLSTVLDLRPGQRQPHPLHGGDRFWPETNCYVDLWIEVLAGMGHDPTSCLAFTVTQDFEHDQFTFMKFPLEDLAVQFGLQVQELALYDDVEDHLAEQIAFGRLPLIEVDAYYLPDTRGVSYGVEHSKTTVAVARIDRPGRRMEYVHNLGCHVAEGTDYEGLFERLRVQYRGEPVLYPYAEFVKTLPRTKPIDLVAGARRLLGERLAMRPMRNPVIAFRESLEARGAVLVTRPIAYFHKYAFNTVRQLGANFELLSAHLAWLTERGEPGLSGAREAAIAVAGGAKTLQFQMARSFAKRRFEPLYPQIEQLAMHYDAALGPLVELYGA